MLQGGTIHIGRWSSSRHPHFSGRSGGDNRSKQTLHAAAMPDVAPRQRGRRRAGRRPVVYQPLFPSLQLSLLLNRVNTSLSGLAGKKLHLLTRPGCNFHRLKSHICQNTFAISCLRLFTWPLARYLLNPKYGWECFKILVWITFVLLQLKKRKFCIHFYLFFLKKNH